VRGPLVTVAVPTLRAGDDLGTCLRALRNQTFTGYEVVVIDNSGSRAVARLGAGAEFDRLIENQRNCGFGAALNQAFQSSTAPLLATLNDDARPEPEWLEALVAAAEAHPEAGMFACRVLLEGRQLLDSAGMLICGDGSSKQRGHGEAPQRYNQPEEVLCPSGSAALYRREALQEAGWFDEAFFLYCEDTDVGLRLRWLGWTCWYVPGAVVAHAYSRTSGAASRLKAYMVERNRLRVLWKNFPATLLWRAPWVSLSRYYWHLIASLRGKGLARQFVEQGGSVWELGACVVRAHAAWLQDLPSLLRQRQAIRQRARVPAAEMCDVIRRFSTSPRLIASM